MGLVSSKLKKKKGSNNNNNGGSNNLTWSRFGSIASLRKFRQSQLIMMVNDGGRDDDDLAKRKHLDTDKWLRSLDLSQYEQNFSKYRGVEELLDFTETDIKNLGVKISSHRALIMTRLTVLKAKYDKGSMKKRTASLRHSVAVDGGNRKKSSKGTDDSIDDLKTTTTTPDTTPIQSKSLNNLIMEPCMDPQADAGALKKALEWELSLDGRDIRSHAWYHGAIPRSRAEEIVRDEGGFLVRDCTSQPGNFVLTCRTKQQQPLHFVINKIVVQENTVYERIQYQFEDEAFDTVADLITSYVGSGRPITQASGARIQYPKNRMYPLSFYATKYPAPIQQQHHHHLHHHHHNCPNSRLTSPATTPIVTNHLHALRCGTTQSPTRCSLSSHHRDTPPRLPSRNKRSQSLTPNEVNRMAQEKANSADGVIQQQQSPLMTRSAGCESKFSTQSLPRAACGTRIALSPSSLTLGRSTVRLTRGASDTLSLSPCTERRLLAAQTGDEEEEARMESGTPPPKPSRLPRPVETSHADVMMMMMMETKSDGSGGGYPSHGNLQRVASYHQSGSDSGNGSGDSALSSAAGDSIELPQRNLGVVIKNPRYNNNNNNIVNSESSTTLKNFDVDYKEIEEKIMKMLPVESAFDERASRFDLENCQTLLLPLCENKPLDGQALKGIKIILKESGSRILANHLTRSDLDLFYGKGKITAASTIIAKHLRNGLELCTLPHGHQFRMDLIERTECLKLLVAVTILTCSDETERAETLNKWIEVAIDTKTALGNLYGFCGVMLGLCLPQVQKLHSTWHLLRQKFTDSTFNFEAKLRPTLNNMNNCSNPLAPNTTIPHLLPYVLLIERNLDGFMKVNEQTTTTSATSSSSSCASTVAATTTTMAAYVSTFVCLESWETNTQDFGLATLLKHLDSARKFANLSATFQRNAEIGLGEARMEELTLDLFRTEFQMKFLWGSRGAFATSQERHAKFQQVLNVLAEKYCNVQNDSEV